MGVPTAISFGIVSVGNLYGAMYELVDSKTISDCIALNSGKVEYYAQLMADLAHTIHDIEVKEDEEFPEVSDRLKGYIRGGVEKEDEELAVKCMSFIESLPVSHNLLHGDFHTGNVFLQNGEPILIDMDRLSVGHYIVEISDLYYFYVILGENDPAVVENFMGFSYQTSVNFFDLFLKNYMRTEDKKVLNNIREKASIICYIRMINKIHKKRILSDSDHEATKLYIQKIKALLK